MRRDPAAMEPTGAPVCLELPSDSHIFPAGRFDRAEVEKELLPRIVRLRAYVQRSIPARFRSVIGVDDLLQEISIAAYQRFATFHPIGHDPLGNWLRAIADSKLTDALREARAKKRGGNRVILGQLRTIGRSFYDLLGRLRAPQCTPSRSAHSGEVVRLVHDGIERLTGARRVAMRLYYVDGLSVGEVAGEMHRSGEAVNSLLYFGRIQLRGLLGDASRFFSDASSQPRSSAAV